MQKPDVGRMIVGIAIGIIAITAGTVIVTIAIMRAFG